MCIGSDVSVECLISLIYRDGDPEMSFHNTKSLIKTESKDRYVYDNNTRCLGRVNHHINISRTTTRSYFGKESTQERCVKQTSFSHKALLISTSIQHHDTSTHIFYLCECMKHWITQKYTRNVKDIQVYSKFWSKSKRNIILTHGYTDLHSSCMHKTNHTRYQLHKRTQTHTEDP